MDCRPLIDPSPHWIAAPVRSADFLSWCADPATRVAVFGGRAIRALDPLAVKRALTRGAVSGLLFACTPNLKLFARWVRLDVAAVVDRRDIRQEVSAALLRARPSRLSIDAWLRAASEMRALADCRSLRELAAPLVHIVRMKVDDWARALGRDRHQLKRLLGTDTPMRPRDFVRSYKDTNVRSLSQRGYTVAQIAQVLGLSDGSSVSRARRSSPHRAR